MAMLGRITGEDEDFALRILINGIEHLFLQLRIIFLLFVVQMHFGSCYKLA